MNSRLRPVPYIAGLTARFPGYTIQSLVLILVMALVNLPLPLLQKVAIDLAIPAGQGMTIIALGIFAFLVRALASAFQVFQNHVVWSLMASIGDSLRQRMSAALLRGPYHRYVDGEMGGYVGRLSSDLDAIENTIFETFSFVIRPLAMIAVMAVVMLVVSPLTTLVLFVTSPIAIFVSRRMSEGLRSRQERILEQRQDLQSQVTEILDNIRVIRSYTAENRYRDQIRAASHAYSGTAVALATRRQLVNSIVEMINLTPFLALIAVGAPLVAQGHLTIGEFMLFITFEQLLRSPLVQLAYYILNIKAEMAAPERVQAVIDLPPERPAKPAQALHRGPLRGKLSLTDLHFAYRPERPILTGLDLQIAAGERIAVVGDSGAGKTTLFNLLLGFYSPTAGELRYDGVPIADWDLQELRRHIGVVFQHNPLLEGSVRDNLVLDGREIADEELWQALAGADADAFVASLPAGLDTLVGVKGMKLSGGQRQRLAIARALLRRPRLVLLDEATSSLDSVSEQQIRRALEHLLADRTSLTIAHRLSTVISADRILYLSAGRIIEDGSHEHLLAARGAYWRLYQAQTDGLLPEP